MFKIINIIMDGENLLIPKENEVGNENKDLTQDLITKQTLNMNDFDPDVKEIKDK